MHFPLILTTVKSLDFTQYAYLLIVILSHGGRHEIVCAKNGEYSIPYDVILPILTNPTLKDKPKFFFTQACRGDIDLELDATTDGSIPDDNLQSSTPYKPKEVFQFHSTFEGKWYQKTETQIILDLSFVFQDM